MADYILAIDQGTTSTRSMIFDKDMNMVSVAQEEFPQYYPESGWVEHDVEEIWATVVATLNIALSKANLTAQDIKAIGITNQRETTVIWNLATGQAIHNAIVWQDRRTSEYCAELKSKGLEEQVSQMTGLLLDPYFSGTKVNWLLENVDGARERAESGDLAFGTIDSFLIWRLTGGKSHVTDATNASRTMLYDIRANEWSSKMCEILNVPMSMLPEVKDCADDFGDSTFWEHPIPIYGVAGDQQAATIGQACFEAGMLKSTYGTGCFALMNTGEVAVASKNRLLTTIAYRLDGETTYALEGSIFIAGAVVQWLRDGLKIVANAGDTQALAEKADDKQDVTIVPAFTGLGAPYWKPETRGAIFGLTRATTEAELARAALQSVGLQTHDLTQAMIADMGDQSNAIMRVDGGMSASDYAMQYLSDILNVKVDRPKVLETTILGAAWLAGFRAGIYPSKEEFAQKWQAEKRFEPMMDNKARETKLASWKRAVDACMLY